MAAARTGKPEPSRLLLARGADVNATEGWLGQTALMWAAARDHPSGRADPHRRGSQRERPLRTLLEDEPQGDRLDDRTP